MATPNLQGQLRTAEKFEFDYVNTMSDPAREAADCGGIGDAAASLVGPEIYREYAWPFEKRLVDGIHAFGAKVRLHICGNTRKILDRMGTLGATSLIWIQWRRLAKPAPEWARSRRCSAI